MSIGSKIKELRRERDMTQDQLAEYLGITANAVSQWECDRTAPDISQLPILANLFEVTTDALLEVDISKKQSNIDRISQEAWTLCSAGDKIGAAQHIRDALGKYPDSYALMSDLIIFLYQQAFQQECSEESHALYCAEAADYIDEIIGGCNDVHLQGKAIALACSIFPVIGRYDDVLKLVTKIPDTSKEDMLASLYKGDQLIEHIKNVICNAVSTAADQISWLATMNNGDGVPLFDDDAKIILHQKAIVMYKTLYENRDFFFDAESLAITEKRITDICAKRKNADDTLFHLRECIAYTVMFDSYDESRDMYTSLIPFGKHPTGINRNNPWNTSHEMLEYFLHNEAYDFIRDTAEFQTLLTQLKQTDNMR